MERLRQQEEEIGESKRQKELAEEVNTRLQDDVDAAQRMVEELRGTLAEKEAAEAERNKEIEEMQTALDDFEEERKEFEEELSEAEARVSDREEKLRESRVEMDNLRNKIAFLDEQNRELKKEEVDFKRTIGVAQRFADDLMEKTKLETETLVRQSEQRAEEVLAASEEKAAMALQAARDEIERLRREAYAELSRLPEEIEQLSRQRKRVRDELRSILTGHLEQLESFAVDDEEVSRYDYDELFQKIDFSEPDELFPPMSRSNPMNRCHPTSRANPLQTKLSLSTNWIRSIWTSPSPKGCLARMMICAANWKREASPISATMTDEPAGPVGLSRDGVTIVCVYVQPRAAKNRFCGVHDGALKLAVKAPPVDGKANKAVAAYLAELFDVNRRSVALLSGNQSRRKVFTLESLTEEQAQATVAVLVASAER